MLSPYLLQESEDGYSYEFTTDLGNKYLIYFKDSSYLFQDYPEIIFPILSFSIDCIQGDPERSSKDERIGLTVSYIMNLFFSKLENIAVYVCDSIDERQYARKRKFDIWFASYNDGSLIKEDGKAIVDGDSILNSIILHIENPQLKEIINAYRDLNESITRGDK